MHVVLFFTFDYSLKLWDETGILSREKLYFYEMLKENKNLEFTLVTYGDETDLNYFKNNSRINVYPIYKKNKYFKSKFIRLSKSLVYPFKLKKELRNISLIKQFQLNGAWVSILFKFLTNKPLIMRTGYDMYEFSIRENKKFYKKLMYKYLTSFALKFSDLYTVASRSDINFLKKNFKINNKNIELRPNWVLENNTTPVLNRNRNNVLAVGRLEAQKNYEDLIKAFSNSSFKLDIYGDGSLKDDLKELAELENTKVNFKGVVSYNELQKIYNKYVFFISTSLYEGNPKTILEAQSSGCLVVVLNEKNTSEIIDNGKTGIILNNKNNILESLKKLSKDDKNIEFISNNAYQETVTINGLLKNVKIDIEDFNSLIKKT